MYIVTLLYLILVPYDMEEWPSPSFHAIILEEDRAVSISVSPSLHLPLLYLSISMSLCRSAPRSPCLSVEWEGRDAVQKGGWHAWKPSSSANLSIRAFRAVPLVDTRQAILYRAVRGNSISIGSILPPSSFSYVQTSIFRTESRKPQNHWIGTT